MLNHKTDYVKVFYVKKLPEQPEVLILFDAKPFLLLESNIETPVIRVCGSIICETIQMNQCSNSDQRGAVFVERCPPYRPKEN